MTDIRTLSDTPYVDMMMWSRDGYLSMDRRYHHDMALWLTWQADTYDHMADNLFAHAGTDMREQSKNLYRNLRARAACIRGLIHQLGDVVSVPHWGDTETSLLGWIVAQDMVPADDPIMSAPNDVDDSPQ